MYWLTTIIFIIIAAIGCISTSNRSPFQTEQVREIWHNMTKAERTAANRKSFGFGVFIGIMLALIPGVIGLNLGLIFLHSALKGMILGSAIFPFVVFALWKALLPYLNKSWRMFFASTEWAKNHQIQANKIRLFKWEQQNCF